MRSLGPLRLAQPRPHARWTPMRSRPRGAGNFDQAAPANAGDAMVGPAAAAASAGVGECAANAADAMAGPEAAAAGARVCTAIPRVVRICECAPGIFINEVGERCDRCLISVKFSVAQVSIVSFNHNCMT